MIQFQHQHFRDRPLAKGSVDQMAQFGEGAALAADTQNLRGQVFRLTLDLNISNKVRWL